MIRVWYDIATLEVRYMETAPSWDGKIHAIRADGNTIDVVDRSSALEVSKYSRVIREPQELLDALIAYGLKPSKTVGNVGHVEALEKHIAFAESVVARVLK